MRWRWALPLLALILAFSGGARADPAISGPQPGVCQAQWTFSNPANYTSLDVTFGGSGVSLTWTSGSFTDTTRQDFRNALVTQNVDLDGSPGDIAVLNRSQLGPMQTTTFQPDPAPMADNYLYEGNGGNPNFGVDADLRVGNWGGSEWNRAILRFPALPLPSNATLLSARLELYMHTADTPEPMDVSVHRVLATWTELGSNWKTTDGAVLWSAPGGDFDPAVVDIAAGITTVLGWYDWNVTSLVQGWWLGTIPNQGLMVRQADDTTATLGRKQFNSSDAPDPGVRPRLVIEYKTPGSTAILESGVFDAGSTALWDTASWSATVPGGTTAAIQTRSGDTPIVDASWSPWSSPVPVSGASILSPSARRIQYRATLFTPDSTSPVLRAVTLGFGRYHASGTIQTESLSPSNLSMWQSIEVNWSGPPATSVDVEYSQDDGLSWMPVQPTANLSSALVRPIVVRLTLTTANTTRTPQVHSIIVSYSTSDGGTGIPAIALWPLVIPVAIALLWVVARRLAKERYRPTDLFLIHTDGSLVMRVGGEENAMTDDLAASSMFTLVASFVRDSFGGSGAGELKSMKVDEREVVIGKGKYLYLALVLEGSRPPELDGRISYLLGWLEGTHEARLRSWNGLRAGLEPLEGQLAWFLRKGHRRARPVPPGHSRS